MHLHPLEHLLSAFVLNRIRKGTWHEHRQHISALLVLIVRLETDVHIINRHELLLRDVDLERRENAAVHRPRMVPIGPFSTQVILDEELTAFLRANWNPLELPLPLDVVLAIINNERQLRRDEILQGALLVLDDGIGVLLQTDLVGVLCY